MEKHLLAILTILVGFCLTSCSSTRTYQRINNIIFPEYRLPDDTRQLILLNAIEESTNPSTYNRERFTSTDDGRENVAAEFSNQGKSGYMMDRLNYSLNRGNYYLVKRNSSSTYEGEKWDRRQVKTYAGDGDVLIVLEDFESDYDFHSEKIRKHQLDQSGKDYYIDAYEASRKYRVSSKWILYDGTNGETLHLIEDSGEKFIKTQGLHKDQTIEKLDSISKGVERYLIDSMAQSFSNLIMPRKVFDTWSYYKKGSDELEQGSKYMELDKLEEATEIYRKGLMSADEDIQARIFYNLSVICDIQGDLPCALDYAEKAVLADDKSLHKSFYEKVKLKLEISRR